MPPQRNGSSVTQASGVQVFVRVRPTLPRELMFNCGVDVLPPNTVKLYTDAQEFASTYHHVFPEASTQADVYEKVRDCVHLALSGYNSTIFAYGQTGTGKTYTMMGDETAMDALQEGGDQLGGHGGGGSRGRQGDSGPGIIPRAVKELFRQAKSKQDLEGTAMQVIASYMEIYNDRLYDLLQPYKKTNTRDPLDMNQRRALLEVREDARGNTYVPNLLCVKVKSYKSVFQLIAKGNRNRAVRHTEMNQASSRSHAILQLVVEQWPHGGADGTVIRSKLNFVDLAGSERWSMAAAAEPWLAAGSGQPDFMGEERISELTAINGSLSALGSVVAALTERRPHVPYRDSVLTHLLQDSLGGNCRTTLVATVSPSCEAFDESCSTLRFADRARAIANNPVVNASRDVGSVLALKEKEIQRLRQMLTQMQGGPSSASGGPPDQLVEELEATRRALEQERALRAELEHKLTRSGTALTATDGDASFSGGAPAVQGRQQPLGATAATAFDAAGAALVRGPGGTPLHMPLAPASLSSAGQGARPLQVGGAPRHMAHLHQGYHDEDEGLGDFELRAVPSGLAASGPSTPKGPPSPQRGSGSVPRSRAGGSHGAPRAPSAARPRSESQRRLSFDEAVMSIKSQIINLSSQERSRQKARQAPAGRTFWGTPGSPGIGSTAATPPAAAQRSKSYADPRMHRAYGSGPASPRYGSAVPSPAAHARRGSGGRPPALLVPGTSAATDAWGSGTGAGGRHYGDQIPVLEMADSPTGSSIVSPMAKQVYASAAAAAGGGGSRLRDSVNPDSPLSGQHYAQQQQQRQWAVQPPPRSAAPPAPQHHDDGDDVYASANEDQNGGGQLANQRSEAGLSDLDPDEYAEIMKEAREAVERQRQAKAAAASGSVPAELVVPPPAAPPAKAASGGGFFGFGRRSVAPPPSAAAAGGVAGAPPPLAGQQGSAPAPAGGWGRSALANKFTDAPTSASVPGDDLDAAAAGAGSWGRSSVGAHTYSQAAAAGVELQPPGSSGGWGRSSLQSSHGPPPPAASAAPPPPPAAGRSSLGPAAAAAAGHYSLPSPYVPAGLSGKQSHAMELKAEHSAGSRRGGSASHSPKRASPHKAPGNPSAQPQGARSQSVGTAAKRTHASPLRASGTANSGVAKLDTGSWIYILGASASSTRAKRIAEMIQMDARTGLPAL